VKKNLNYAYFLSFLVLLGGYMFSCVEYDTFVEIHNPIQLLQPVNNTTLYDATVHFSWSHEAPTFAVNAYEVWIDQTKMQDVLFVEGQTRYELELQIPFKEVCQEPVYWFIRAKNEFQYENSKVEVFYHPELIPPTLEEPEDEQSFYCNSFPTLKWNPTCFDAYQLEIADEKTFSTPVLSQTVVESSFTITPALEKLFDQGVQYYWRVSSLNNEDMSTYSTVRSFWIMGGECATIPLTPIREIPGINNVSSIAVKGLYYNCGINLVWLEKNAQSLTDLYFARINLEHEFLIEPTILQAGLPFNSSMQLTPIVSDGEGFAVVFGAHSIPDPLSFVRFDSNGSIFATTALGTLHFAGSEPWLSFDGTHYGVVWEDYRPGTAVSNGLSPNIFYAAVGLDGSCDDTLGIHLSQDGGVSGYDAPTLDWNGNHYGMAYYARMSGGDQNLRKTRFLTLDADGTVTSISLNLDGDDLYFWFPKVIWTGTHYLLVRSARAGDAIRTAQINADGTLVADSDRELILGTNLSGVDLVRAGDRFGIVWIQQVNTGFTVEFMELDAQGNPAGSILTLATFDSTYQMNTEFHPLDLSYNGCTYNLAFGAMDSTTGVFAYVMQFAYP
jgi:hypothetical protein